VRTLPCDLADKVVKELLSDHVQMANCKPKVLFCLNQITKQSTSSEWGIMSKYLNLLLGTARASDGRVPRQYDFHTSFKSWLQDQHLDWSFRDTDRCVRDFRIMLMGLLAIKRGKGRACPRTYPQLQVVIDALKCDTEDHDRDKSRAPPRPSRSRPCSAASSHIVVCEIVPNAVAPTVVDLDQSDSDEGSKRLEQKLFNTPKATASTASESTQPKFLKE
jgi:hypothetical protein